MRCLLVDDEPGIREGLAMLLRRRGFEVTTAADCAAAAEQLAQASFDVVVTDWRLPDGLALEFVRDCTTPVIAVSGHPEEVQRVEAMCAVMAKPVTPAKLLECIAATVPAPVEQAAVPTPLVRDVQQVVDDLRAQLPAGIAVECCDDGTYVTLRARVAGADAMPLEARGGDLRVCGDGHERTVELRLCREGKPDDNFITAPIDRAWPDAPRVALDCESVSACEDTFVGWLDQAGERMRAGVEMSLINVPEALASATAVWETTHDMPMRRRVGPRLPAELAELWS